MGKQIKLKQVKLCACVLGSALLLYIPNVHAAEAEDQEEYSFDQVVVTATKTPIKVFEANANMTVITRDEIEKNHYHDLSEALRNVPGLYIGNYGAGGVGYEQSNSLKINGSDQIVVLIDGVRVNVAGQKFQANIFSTLDNVEKIEVLKGSASALYGSDAKGGVINIITRKVEGSKTTLTLTGGSYNKENYSFANQGQSGDYSWMVTSSKDILGNYKDAHGLEVPQHKNADINSLRLTKKISEVSDLIFSYDQYQADGYYSGSNYYLTDRYNFTNDNYNWRMTYNYKFSEDMQNQLSFMNNSFDETYYGRTYIKTIGIQDQFTKRFGDQHLVTTGFDFTKDKVVTTNNISLINRALYIQDEWNMNQRWKITSGIRSDWHSGYDNRVTPRVTLGYKQNNNTNYYIAYNEFFIAPTPAQLYSNFYGNNQLKPEDGKSLEVGVNHKFDETLTATLHAFKRESDNAVGWVHTGPGLWDGTYQNFDEKTQGWDIQLNKKVSKYLNAFVGYTHTIIDPTKEKTQNANGYIPKGAWNIGLNYQQEKYDIQIQGRGVIDRPGPQTTDTYAKFFPANTYWVWDVTTNYKVNHNMKAFVKINNIFDKFYAEQSNARLNWGGASEEWYTSPGRNYQIGIQYQF
ncbi:MAG: cirA 4 [Sporomusa sp.]|nr:cirA 4 [Sporomusa sp.]